MKILLLTFPCPIPIFAAMPSAIPQGHALAEFVTRGLTTAREIVAACGHRLRLPGPLVVAIWSLLGHRMRRIAILMTRYAEGTLPAPRRPGTTPRQPQSKTRLAPAPRLIKYRRGWMMRHIQETAFVGSALEFLLLEPGLTEFLAACPQAKRPLRSLWWAINYTPLPDILRAKPKHTAPPPPPALNPAPAPAAASAPPQPPPTPPAPVAQEASFIPHVLFLRG